MADKAVDEGKQNVGGIPSEEVGEKEKGHPDTVPWNQYVGIKEKFTRVETELGKEIASLKEQLKNAGSAEEVTKLKTQLAEATTATKKASDDLAALKETSLSEKRILLIKKGVPEAEAKGLSEKELGTVLKVLETHKPKPDMGSGSGGTVLTGSPMELARQAYSQNK